MIELQRAKLCLECEGIFEGEACPRCGQAAAWQWLSIWARSLMGDPVDRVLAYIGP